MAIYRTGTASLAANGVVIGVGTKWQDKLSLIRVGATIMFPTVVGAIGTISAIVSDTELRVMTTNGAVVPAGSQYVILLHDSITVDGLAQDVAETLRYYQSKETEVADAIDFFKTFDWEQFKVVADKITADAAAANASKVAAAGSATAAAGSAAAAKTSETNAKASETAANASKLAAAASQVAAKTSETNAKTSETAAKTSETNALASKNAAAASQTAALASQNAAKTSETNAKTSETNSKTSETNAKASETAALASKNAAAASQTAAAGSATAALASQNAAKTSENNAKNYADSINPSLLLAKNQNLADLANKDTARSNIGLDRFFQLIGAGETRVKSGDASKWVFVKDNGDWGCWDSTTSKAKALALPFGGTGASDAAGARTNFDVYSKEESLDAVGIGASPRHIADMADIPKGFARIVDGSTTGGISGFTGAGWIAQVDGSPSYAGMFVQPDGNRVFAGGQNIGSPWSWHEIPTLDRNNQFKGDIEILREWPGLRLSVASAAQDDIGGQIHVENNGKSSLNIYFTRKDGNTAGRSKIAIERPPSEVLLFMGMNGGLAPNGTNDYLFSGNNFNVQPQGWRNVGGPYTNGPTSGSVYGSLFTQCTQGLYLGNSPDVNPNQVWWQQRFFDTNNRIFTRINTNQGAWGGWTQLTTSAVSDERLKNVLGNLNVEGALDNINRMEFKLFKFKEEQVEGKEPTLRRGVISQQLRLIDKEYTKEIGGYYHLDQTPMLLDGLAAIKALRERDEDNKVRIAKLESDIEELKAMVLALSSK